MKSTPNLWPIDQEKKAEANDFLNNKIYFNKPEAVVPTEKMDIDLPGYAWDLLPYNKKPFDLYRSPMWHAEYLEENRSPYAAIQTSLGCQFKCSFCMINLINRSDDDEIGVAGNYNKMRFWSPEFIIKEFVKLLEFGVKIIRKENPQQIFGNSVSNFIYDYFCLKDSVKKDFDIILELGLITSSLSIIFCRHKGKVIVTNLDGLEWKRSKWGKIVQKITKALEKYGVMFSDYLIADNIGIQKYILKEYGRESEMIAYGTKRIKKPNIECLKKYGLEKNNYLLSVARLEPENNLEMMFDAYSKSKIQTPYFLVGNHSTPYGNFLKDKYRDSGIVFLGEIFNKDHLFLAFAPEY